MPYIAPSYFQKRFLERENIKFRLRNSLIPFIFIDKKIKIRISNGIWYLSVQAANNMLGFKFGEFSLTKRSDTQTHLKKKRKKKTKGKK